MSAQPGLFTQLWLLWSLRLRLGLNRGKRPHRALSLLAYLAACAPAVGLFLAFEGLLRLPAVAGSAVWPAFLLGLIGFVTTCLWASWPVLSAGVDDHSELSRYASFPLSTPRLLAASTLASLFEPRAVVFYAPVLGATVGYVRVHALPAAMVAALLLAYALFNASVGRVALHLTLNLLKQRRNGELIGGFFLLFLVACSFLPPVDTRWLTASAAPLQAIGDDVLRNAALALTRVPSGFLARGVLLLARGDWAGALMRLTWLIALAVLASMLAHRLLVAFHRERPRGRAASQTGRSFEPLSAARSLPRALALKEAIDLWHNPRARLLASVPFILAILLRLLSGRDLFVVLLGASADAWLVGAFTLYATVLMASTFAQNSFGYDGQGFVAFLAAPVALDEVLRAKNRVHGLAAAGLALLVAAFYRLYFRAGAPVDLALALLGAAALLPVLLLAGNFLSLTFPVKFHVGLQRKDRLPFAASMLGVFAAALGASPWALALRWSGREAPGLGSLAFVGGAAALAWVAYLSARQVTRAHLAQRREAVLAAVTRD